MKKKTLLKPFVLAVLALSFSFAPVSFADKGHEETPLAKAMDEIRNSLNSLRKMNRDDWDGGARASRNALKACQEAMKYTPPLIEDMQNGQEKDVAIADAKRLMGLTYAGLAELELAYLSKDLEKITNTVDKLKALKKEGHKKYEDG